MLRPDALFTPLITLSASTLYEQEDHSGNIGGWRPEMLAWTLRDAKGAEVPHPEKGAHWMDFGNMEWADHWREQARERLARTGAFGVVATELPLGNASVGNSLQKYPSNVERGEAMLQWLRRVRGTYMMVPSALGMDGVVEHSILPVEEKFRELELSGRYWDYFQPLMDGAWAEGWIQPYWAEVGLPRSLREIHVAAANRAAKNGQVFIASAAYRNDAELETLLAHYLLASYRQGSMVFQPMPILPSLPPEAGLSLAVLRKQVKEKAALLQVPLGAAQEEKVRVRTEGGVVYRRRYQLGVVYVNPADNYTARLPLGSSLRRTNGKEAGEVELPPRSGVILLYVDALKVKPPRPIKAAPAPKPLQNKKRKG
jgi:hypothetical protein